MKYIKELYENYKALFSVWTLKHILDEFTILAPVIFLLYFFMMPIFTVQHIRYKKKNHD